MKFIKILTLPVLALALSSCGTVGSVSDAASGAARAAGSAAGNAANNTLNTAGNIGSSAVSDAQALSLIHI